MQSAKKIYGIIPPVTTPFDINGEIDEKAFETQCNWFYEKGCHGITVGGSTGEGHTLDPVENKKVAELAVKTVGEEIPVIAGIITDSTRDAVTRGNMIANTGVVALQVTPVHYLFRPDDEAMQKHFHIVSKETGLSVIIYNVVPWSYLSPELLCHILSQETGVIGVKQSAGDLKLLADLLELAPKESLILSAVDALLYPSFCLGADGAVAAILSAAPGACVALWDSIKNGDHNRALDLHKVLLNLWNAIEGDNLPACVKYAQTIQDCPGGLPRSPMSESTELQKKKINQSINLINDIL